jgi:hypothetical protein
LNKVFGLSLTLVIVAMLLMGCGGKGNSTTTTSATTSASSAATTTKATTSAVSTTSTSTSAAPTTSTSTKATTTTASSTPSTSGNDLSSLLGKAASSYSCDVSMTSAGSTTTSKYWVKMGNPTMFKMESTVGTLTTITIFDGTRYYMYTAYNNTAIVLTVPPAQPSDATSTTQFNPKYIGSKTVNSYACAGYEYTASGVLTTMWISTQYGVTVEIATATSIIDYSNFNFNVPDSTFQLPAGAIIMTFPGM